MSLLKLLIKSYLGALACIIIISNSLHAQTNDPVQIATEYYNQGDLEKPKMSLRSWPETNGTSLVSMRHISGYY